VTESTITWDVLRSELLDSSAEDLRAFGFTNSPVSADVQAILRLPWTLLADAGSCVAFSDPSQSYVLKLFKSSRGVIRKFHDEWNTNLGKSSWTPYPGDEVRTADFKIDKTLRSAAFATQCFAKQTGTVFAQLLPASEGESWVTLECDRVNVRRKPFVLQRRAESLEIRLTQCVEAGDLDRARQSLDDFLAYVEFCWRCGVTDTPFNFSQNYGYVVDNGAERFVQFDIGDFHFGRHAIQHEIVDRVMLRHYSVRWLGELSSELADYLRDRVDEQFRLDHQESLLSHLPDEINHLSYFDDRLSPRPLW
jgi:hypothetical protein